MIEKKGFTLVEILLVLAIISIIIMIATPRLSHYKAITEEQVCMINRKQIALEYELYLFNHKVNHNTFQWNMFFDNCEYQICPTNGVLNYENGKVNCTDHTETKEEEVPFL